MVLMDAKYGPLYKFIWHKGLEGIPGYIIFMNKSKKIIFNPRNKIDNDMPRVIIVLRTPYDNMNIDYIGYEDEIIHQMFEVIFQQ